MVAGIGVFALADASSNVRFPTASSAIPASRFAVSASGSGRTSAIAAHSATVTAVCTASPRRRRPDPSARVPVSGASRAIRTPAAVRPQPSQAECAASRASSAAPPSATASGATKSSLVSQRVNTKVVITALNAAEPQSHSAQAVTGQRPGRAAVASGAGAGGGTASACTDQAYPHGASGTCRQAEHGSSRAAPHPAGDGLAVRHRPARLPRARSVPSVRP